MHGVPFDLVCWQESKFAVNLIQGRVVRGAFYSQDDEKRLQAGMLNRHGTGTEEEIGCWLPRGSGGKLRLVISSLHGGRIAVEQKV